MQIQTEPADLPRPPQSPNEDAARFGWDAREVWRTRIKAVYDARVALRLVALVRSTPRG